MDNRFKFTAWSGEERISRYIHVDIHSPVSSTCTAAICIEVLNKFSNPSNKPIRSETVDKAYGKYKTMFSPESTVDAISSVLYLHNNTQVFVRFRFLFTGTAG
jgi:hypothetical protein